jgi:hypothetical protein
LNDFVVAYGVAEIVIGNQTFKIPDCTQGGDHGPLLRQTLKTIIDSDRTVSSEMPCGRCKKDVIVRRHPTTGVISASLEGMFTEGFAEQ